MGGAALRSPRFESWASHCHPRPRISQRSEYDSRQEVPAASHRSFGADVGHDRGRLQGGARTLYQHVPSLEIPQTQVFLLMASSMVGSLIQLPGVGGGSQLATMRCWITSLGSPPELATSCGIMLWLVTFIAVVPVGLLLAHRERLSLRKLSRRATRRSKPAPIVPRLECHRSFRKSPRNIPDELGRLLRLPGSLLTDACLLQFDITEPRWI